LKKVLTIFLFGLLAGGCEKSQENDEYYVKYQVESSTIYFGGKLNVQFSDINGSIPLVINQRENWETTIGPVQKGYIASISATKQGWDGITAENHLKLYLRIQVSKNNGPFTLKQLNGSDTPRATASTQYMLE
jgi:hypothetical protein